MNQKSSAIQILKSVPRVLTSDKADACQYLCDLLEVPWKGLVAQAKDLAPKFVKKEQGANDLKAQNRINQ